MVLTVTFHSGQIGGGRGVGVEVGVGVGVGIGVVQISVLLRISQIAEHIIVRHKSDPRCTLSNITSPKDKKNNSKHTLQKKGTINMKSF